MISGEHPAGADEVVPLADCLELAKRLSAADHHWHHHVLFPGCMHNSFDRYALLIEDDDERCRYYAEADAFPEVDKDLVQMLHGDDILNPNRTSSITGAHIDSPLVQHARDLVGTGGLWHHHMCFPTCTLNPAHGRWTIVIEAGPDMWADSFDDEPVDTLREIEVLFFSIKAPALTPPSTPGSHTSSSTGSPSLPGR
jgi:hypothetical protein